MAPVLSTCVLPIFLYFVLKYFNLSEPIAIRIPVILVFYFWGGYFLRKQGWSKAFGIVLFLIAIALNLVFINPTYVTNEFKATIVFLLFPLLASIFLILRQGKLLRLLGVLVMILIVPSAFFMAYNSYFSPTAITGKDRTIILASAESRINDLFQAWNDKDYQKFSKDFSDEMKGKFSQDKFLSVRDESGKLISTDELRKVAPKSDSPSVTVEGLVINVIYGVIFEKDPIEIYAFTVQFLKYDSKYLIRGLTFDIIGGTVNTNSGVTTYSVSIPDPKTKTTKRYRCSSPSYDYNQAQALLPSALLQQKLEDEVAQLNGLAIQLNKMGSQNSTNNYDIVANDYQTQTVTYETNKKQYDSEEQAYENYIKTHCTYVGN